MLRVCSRRLVTRAVEANNILSSTIIPSSTFGLFSTSTEKEPFQAKPGPLNFSHPVDAPHPWVEKSAMGRLALNVLGYYSRATRLQQGALRLYAAIQAQAENTDLQNLVALPQNFATTHSLLCLHVWMVLSRLRAEGKDGKDLSQEMYDLFQENVESRVRKEGVKVRVSKWLSELETTFYGSAKAYDRALEGSEDLSQAILRNVYGGEEASMNNARKLDRYLRREIACLAMTDTEAVVEGQIRFTVSF